MKRLLVQTQLSNINYKHNKFDLACDSGWQMVMGRVREMLRLNPELDVTVMCPIMEDEGYEKSQVVAHPVDVCNTLWERYGADGEDRLHFFGHNILPNALVTRFDFDWSGLACGLDLGMMKIGRTAKYDAVYINDPMHLRNFKAMFHVIAGYQPRFYVHSHFVDVPEVPKFPAECSLWLGQCEAALRADYNFWQCESAMLQFFDSMGKWFTQDVVDDVRAKSMPWDDGYSSSEISDPLEPNNVRFTPDEWNAKTQGKTVLFFPNRISPSSGDYTNGMKFMFELLPELRKLRQDFVVVCGNPNQKFSNQELEEKCGKDGYVKLIDDTFTRDEYKFVARHSHIALGLYNADAYGGTAARECIELGCLPLWLDNYEYSSLAREADATNAQYILVRPDMSDLVDKLDARICSFTRPAHQAECKEIVNKLLGVVRHRCSYELTTPPAMARMGLSREDL
jgi:hypothetical protein